MIDLRELFNDVIDRFRIFEDDIRFSNMILVALAEELQPTTTTTASSSSSSGAV
uniref:Uncharacterized protein n=1 Tax=Carcinus maenas virus 1 TaxID=2704945 RepID=A0A6G9HDA4_9VIRU|nr:hypothetical protein [Carcinus maenas virus 1]